MPIAYPYKMSDFYGYDQDCSTLTSFTSANAESSLEGCNETLNQTYYQRIFYQQILLVSLEIVMIVA